MIKSTSPCRILARKLEIGTSNGIENRLLIIYL